MEGVKDGLRPLGVSKVEDLYGLIGEVTIILEREGLTDKAEEFVSRAIHLTTYDAVLNLSRDYVTFGSSVDSKAS